MAVLLAAKDQDLSLRDRASTKPVLDVVLEALRPDFDQLPVWSLLARIRVKTLNVRHRWLIASQHVDEAVLNRDSSRQVAIAVKLWLLAPLVAHN